jgi:hypothetical protein
VDGFLAKHGGVPDGSILFHMPIVLKPANAIYFSCASYSGTTYVNPHRDGIVHLDTDCSLVMDSYYTPTWGYNAYIIVTGSYLIESGWF